jgi:dTDP-glucose 4,6-dehydratase
MRVAVIGASSFSGAAFCRHARANGYEVLELSRSNGYDLNDRHAVPSGLLKMRPDYIVNFAALNMVGESWEHAADYYQTNVVAMSRVLDWVEYTRAGWLKKFVQVSTPEVYGPVAQTRIAEGAPFAPSTPYAVSRAAADMHALALFRARGLPVCFTRTVNVYGPGQQPYRIVPKTILSVLFGRRFKLHGGGHSVRSFIHIDDVAEAILRVAVDGRAGETYHVARAGELSIRELVAWICGAMDKTLEDVADDAAERTCKDLAYRLDDTKIRRELGWSDRISLADGIEQTVEWFSANAHLYRNASLEYEHRS